VDGPLSTPGVVADNSARGLISQLDEVWTSLAELGASLTGRDWVRPTACPGWPVSAHYGHLIGAESMLLGQPQPKLEPVHLEHVRNDIGRLNEVWVAEFARVPRQDVLARWARVTQARREALAVLDEEDFSKPSWTPVGQADYRRFMQIRVFDCWVHEQDVRAATGRPGHEEGPVAEQAVDEIARALGYIVGKKAGVPDGSSVTFRLTGPVRRTLQVVVDGRGRLVDEPVAIPTATVTLNSAVFTRLACGRVDPVAVSAQVDLDGDAGLGRRIVDNLAFTI
jgi:uncharacterized protein (TIGR03083 family)